MPRHEVKVDLTPGMPWEAAAARQQAALREALKENPRSELVCFACRKLRAGYPRNITGSMAQALIGLYRHPKSVTTSPWVHVDEFAPEHLKQSDFAKLRFWDLIVPLDTRTADKNASGRYCITQRGQQWVEHKILISKYACVYDNELLRLEGKPISIHDALGTGFDYEKLMRGDLD